MSDIAKLFAELLETAMILDPTALRAEISAGRDTGLRAASYDGAGGRSADVSSHPERMALSPRRDRTDADLQRHAELVGAYVHSIGEIAVRSRSGAPATTWDGAVKHHNLLDQMDAVGVLERTGQKPARLVHRIGDSLHDLERLRDTHMRRDANDHEKSWTSGLADGQCCRICLHLGLRVSWQDGGAAGLCQGCYRLRNRCAAVNDMERDDVPDPPVELVEELRRIGTPGGPADMAARSRWFQRVGDDYRDRRHSA